MKDDVTDLIVCALAEWCSKCKGRGHVTARRKVTGCFGNAGILDTNVEFEIEVCSACNGTGEA